MTDDFWEKREREQRHHDAMMNAGKQGDGVANFLTGMAEAVSRDYKNATHDGGGSGASSGGEYRLPVYDTIPTYSSQTEYREGYGEGGYRPSYDGPIPTGGGPSGADLFFADLEKDLAAAGRFIAGAFVLCLLPVAAAIDVLAMPYKAANAIFKKVTGKSAPVKSTLIACTTWAGIGTGGLLITADIVKKSEYPAMSVVYDTKTNLIHKETGSTIAEADAKAMQTCSVTASCLKLGWAPAGHNACVIANYNPSPAAGMKPYMTYDAENPNADALLRDFARAHGKGMTMADFKENLDYFCNGQWSMAKPYFYLDANPQILAP